MKKATDDPVGQVLALSAAHLTGEPVECITVGSVMKSIGADVRKRLKPKFEQAGVDYPPRRVSLVFIKNSARLELWASAEGEPALIGRFPFKALNTECGPKLDIEDERIPEGVYRVTRLEPNQSGYLAMKLNYPNLLDLKHASREGRHKPKSSVCVQAGQPSGGSIAVSESVSESLFVLLADIGLSSVTVLISPYDPRVSPLRPASNSPRWVADLYQKITDAFEPYRVTAQRLKQTDQAS